MKTFYRAASAAIIVYDITREDTFADIDKEMKIISKKSFIKNNTLKMR